MNIVVDCSFIMSAMLPDEYQEKIESVYHHIASGKYKVNVPSIFYLECNNVLISAFRRNRITENQHKEYIRFLNELIVTVDRFSSISESLYQIANISKKYNLSSYDASYLELAIRLSAPIATLDKKLVDACVSNEIESLVI